MKLAALVSLLFVSSVAICQNNFNRQLKALIKDSTNDYKSFKSGFDKMLEADSLFYSAMILEGTFENDIMYSPNSAHYMANISDSLNEKKSKKLADEWKDKISGSIGSSFKLKQIEITSWNPAIYGWKFERGNTWIDVTVFPEKSPGKCLVVFGILYSRE